MQRLSSDLDMAALVLFGCTVASVLSDPTFNGLPRDLKVVEIFSGVGSVAAAATASGLSSQPFDKFRIEGRTNIPGPSCEDLTVKAGFVNAVKLVMQLALGGLLWLAPVCSSWVGLNISRTLRSHKNNFQGDTTYPKVAEGNLQAKARAFFMQLAQFRGIEVILENPPSSTIFNFPVLRAAISSMKLVNCVTHRCAFDVSAAKGKRLWKKYKFVGPAAWVQKLAKPCPCQGKNHIYLTERWTDCHGKNRFKGLKTLLDKSAAYPAAMGTAAVKAWLSNTAEKHRAPDSETRGQKRKAVWSTNSWLQPSVSGAVDSRPSSKPHWCLPPAGK